MTAMSLDRRSRIEEMVPSTKGYDLPPHWVSPEVRKESPSSLVTFLSCPMKWYLQRHSPLPRESDVSKYSLIGDIVHRVAEVFYSEPAELRTEQLLRNIFDALWIALKQEDRDSGIVPDDMVDAFLKLQEDEERRAPGKSDSLRGFIFNRVAECINNITAFDGDPSALRVAAVEKWVRYTSNRVRFNGKIDRVQYGKGGDLVLVDYKTGRPPSGTDTAEVDVLDPRFIPLGMYALMTDTTNGAGPMEPRVRSVRLHYLQTDTSRDEEGELHRLTLRVTDEVLSDVRDLVDAVTTSMNEVLDTRNIPTRRVSDNDPGPCKWCPFTAVCPAWNEGDMDKMIGYVDEQVDLAAKAGH